MKNIFQIQLSSIYENSNNEIHSHSVDKVSGSRETKIRKCDHHKEARTTCHKPCKSIFCFWIHPDFFQRWCQDEEVDKYEEKYHDTCRKKATQYEYDTCKNDRYIIQSSKSNLANMSPSENRPCRECE